MSIIIVIFKHFYYVRTVHNSVNMLYVSSVMHKLAIRDALVSSMKFAMINNNTGTVAIMTNFFFSNAVCKQRAFMHKSVYFWVETNLRRYYFTLLVKVVNARLTICFNAKWTWLMYGKLLVVYHEIARNGKSLLPGRLWCTDF